MGAYGVVGATRAGRSRVRYVDSPRFGEIGEIGEIERDCELALEMLVAQSLRYESILVDSAFSCVREIPCLPLLE